MSEPKQRKPRIKAGNVAFNIDIPEDLAETIKKMAERNGRSVREEGISALRRHAATPPIVGEAEKPAVKPMRIRHQIVEEPIDDGEVDGTNGDA